MNCLKIDWDQPPEVYTLGNLHFNHDHLPLLLVIVDGVLDGNSPGPFAFRQSMSELYAAKEVSVSVVDFTSAKIPAKAFKTAEEEHIASTSDLIKEFSLGSAMVMKNPVLRIGLKMMLAVSPLPVTHKVVANLEEAVD